MASKAFSMILLVTLSLAVVAMGDDAYSTSYDAPVEAPAVAPSDVAVDEQHHAYALAPVEASTVAPSPGSEDYAFEVVVEAPLPHVAVDEQHHVYAPTPVAPASPHYYHHTQKPTTVVQGYVYCQGCNGQWTKHLTGAVVSAECKTEKGVVVAKGTDTTDEVGFFQIKFPSYDYKSTYGVETCKAKIVKSHDHTCDIVTNAGNGKQGAGVVFLKSFQNEVFFKTGPFAFTQACHQY